MSIISKNTDYAVRALCYLAGARDREVSASELSRKLGVSWPFLRRIMQELSREGLVSSKKGKGGGFRLEIPAHKIMFFELVRIFQGALEFHRCIIRDKVCPNIKNCPLRKKLKNIEDIVMKELKSITIESLAQE